MAVSPDPHRSDLGQLPPAARPESGSVRDAVSRATTRIEEIIDSAERVASEIRADAEAEGRELLESRRREAEELERETDRLRAETERLRHEREEALQGATRGLSAKLGNVRVSLETTLASLDRTDQVINELDTPPPPVADARAGPFPGADRMTPPVPTPSMAPSPETAPDPFVSGPDHAPEPPAGDEPADADAFDEAGPVPTDPLPPARPASGSNSDEAILRATQMAVAGSNRDEISRTLQAEFGIDDPESILGQILGPL